MFNILPPLGLNDKGKQVQNLHFTLFLCLQKSNNPNLTIVLKTQQFTQVFKNEAHDQVYGIITEAIVKTFQENPEIPVDNLPVPASGEIDKPTAEMFNKLLLQYNGLEMNVPPDYPFDTADPLPPSVEPPSGKEYKVSGTVFNNSKEPISGVQVVAYDIDLIGVGYYKKIDGVNGTWFGDGMQKLGETATNADGYYEINFHESDFTEAEGEGWPDVVSFLIINGTVEGRSALSSKKDFTDATTLADWDIIISNPGIRGESEYSKLRSVIDPFMNKSKVPLYQIADSEEQIQFVASETEQDVHNIKLLVTIQVLVLEALQAESEEATAFAKLENGRELLYGITRQNIPLSWPALALIKHADLEKAVQASMALNIIATYPAETVSAFLKTAEALAHNLATQQNNNESNVISKVLSFALGDAAELQKKYLSAVQNHTGTVTDFWKKVLPEQGFKPAAISALQLTNQIDLLGNDNLSLVEELQVNRKINNMQDLLILQEADWKNIVDKTGIPNKPEGATDEEKNNYIASIQGMLNSSFPNQKIALMIKDGTLTIPDEKLNKALSGFLAEKREFNMADNSPHAAGVKETLKAMHPEAFENIKYLQRILQVSPTPKAMSVLYNENKFTSSKDIAEVPLNNFVQTYADKLGGEDIAKSVHERATFLTKRIDQVFMTVHDALYGITPALSIAEGNKELLSAGESAGAVANVIQDYFPDWENLFGTTNVAECRDCQSITSPSAYLVDMLQFLSNANAGDANALNVLLSRRPDLAELPLSCENTNTEIPYIDLVNEIMEYYVVNGGLANTQYKGYDTGDTTSEALHANPQNTNKEAYRILSNSDASKKSIYPFTLPYHQPLDRTRIYLEKMQTSRAELMDVFRKDADGTDQATTNAINAEALHISPAEYQILLDTTNAFAYFGYPDEATLLANAINAQTFIRKAGINYTDLVEILETRFINPGQPALLYLEELFANKINAGDLHNELVRINKKEDRSAQLNPLLAGKISYPDFANRVIQNFPQVEQIITLYESSDHIGPDISKTYLKTIQSLYDASIKNNGIVSNNLSKLHRFIRLWKKLAWSIHELDSIIVAFGETDITERLINNIAVLQKVTGTLSLSIQEASTLWGNIDTYGNTSLYNKLFLNKAVKEFDPVFQPDAVGLYFNDNNAKPLSEHIPAIQAAMKISADDLALILNDYVFKDVPILSIENLSAIYRYVVLARGLQISIAGLITLKQLSGINPFPQWDKTTNRFVDIDPQETLKFILEVQKVNGSGFKIPVLNYIINGEDETGNIQLQQAKILDVLLTILNSIAKINQDNLDEDTATEVLLRRKLQLIFNQTATEAFFNLINNKAYSVNILKDLLLSKLPPNIQYNSKTGVLQSTGIIGDDLKQWLLDLKDDNNTEVPPAFKDAVNLLYQQPDQAITGFIKTNFPGFINENTIPGIIADIKKNQSVQQDAVNNLYVELYKSFLPFLKKTLSQDIVVQMVATLINLDETNTSILLKQTIGDIVQLLSQKGITISTDNQNIAGLLKQIDTFYRAALFINGFKLSAGELQYFIENGKAFNSLDFFKLSFKHWSRVADYASLRKDIAGDTDALIKIFKVASAEGASITKLIEAGLLDEKILPQLNSWFGIKEVKNFQNEISLIRLNKALKLLQKIGAPINKIIPLQPQAVSWAIVSSDFDILWDIAEDIKRTLKAKYSDDEWLLLSKAISNEVRENQKQALIAWLLVQPELQQWGVRDADGLFEYFLIDVQMDACMDTSRMVQAHAAVQLFVDRILLNLENNKFNDAGKNVGISPVAIDPDQWAWRKYYRVWEATREIFLFPENWLEPEWRDDKTPFFKELESELLQNDITADSAETAFRNYLTKLEEVSNLDVCGMHQVDTSSPDSEIYVFARTHHTPYHYYWRKRKDSEWTAWEKIPVDIRGVDDTKEPGVHLLPVFWKNRLILFWPEFTKKIKENSAIASNTDNISRFADNKKFEDLTSQSYWEIRLAWSEYKDGKWQPKVISNEPLIPGFVTRDPYENNGQSYYFPIQNPESSINLSLSITDYLQQNFFGYSLNDSGYNIPAGKMIISSLYNKLLIEGSDTTLEDKPDWDIYRSAFSDSYIAKFQKWKRTGSLHLFDNDYLTNADEHTILFSNQVTDFATNVDVKYPFFYQDAQRVYFVMPAGKVTYREWITDGDTAPPFGMSNDARSLLPY